MSENPRNGATARWRERLEHHNLALKAIRNVNQLITRAKDHQTLLQGVCAALTGTGGYFNAWTALFDEHGALTDICESGLGEDFCPMVEHLQSGRHTRCSRQALAGGGAILVEDPAAVCTDCPLSAMYSGRAAMSAPLAHGGQTFGVLSVSIPAALAGDEEERELFEEVANDLGFALHSLASEEAHATACEALRESEEVMRYIIKHDPNALAVYDRGLHYLAVSDRYLNDYELADQNILGKHHYEVFPEMPQRWRDVHQRVLDGSIEGNDDDWFERPDGSITYNRWECRPWYKAEGSIGGMITYTEVTTERKKAEDALRKSEEKFRTYVEAAPEGIFIANDEGRYIDVNETACEMTGYTREELLNMTVMDLAAPNSESEITESFTHLKRDGHSVAEIRLRRKDGTELPAALKAVSLADGRYMGFCSDITEQKQAQDALKESEQRLRSVFNAVDGVPIQGYDKDRRVIFWNPASEKLYGYSREEALGRALEDLIIPGEARSAVIEGVRKWHDEDVPTPAGEIELVHKSGRRLQVYSNHIMITNQNNEKEMFCIDVDLTERNRAEEELRRSEALLHNVLDLTPAYICAKNMEGRFLLVNQKLAEFYGRTTEDLTGMLHADVCEDEEELTQMLAADREVMESGQHLHIPEETMLRPDGSAAVLETHKIPFTAENEPAVLIIAADITEQKQMAERLRQMEKMDAIGQLAGGVAHDFNNQLAGIMGYADLLQKRADDESLHRYADRILAAAHRSADLTQQLLAFARKGQYQNMPMSLHETVTEVVAILEHTIDPRIEIRQILTANPCTTTGDPSQIQNAVLNLAINARDAMPEGGALTFETRVAELDEAYCRSVPHEIQPGRYVCLSVSDTGTGMDAQTREHIFEPFFTTKEQGEGTGMGLAAVYGTVKQHGGAVNVYSEPGHGSTFRLYFPLTGKDFREQSPSDEESRPIKPLRILLVDDEEVFRDMAGEMLAGVGHTVEAREDGQAAVEWYRAHWQEVDLVILDMIMPKMGGEAAFFEMKRINPDVKVLLASGYSINGAAQDLLAAGVRGFLHKPFTFEDITRAVAEAMDKDAG